MTRKPLPKVIRPTNEELQPLAGRRFAIGDGLAAKGEPVLHPIEAEPELAISSTRPANDPQPERSSQTVEFVAKRHSFARKIVERHRFYATMGGLAPLPIVNVAVLTAIMMRMVKQLSGLYQVPYQRDRTRSAIISLMAGAAPTGFGAIAASTLAFVVPGPGVVGLAVSAVTAGALTHGIGLVFVEHFEKESVAPLSGRK